MRPPSVYVIRLPAVPPCCICGAPTSPGTGYTCGSYECNRRDYETAVKQVGEVEEREERERGDDE